MKKHIFLFSINSKTSFFFVFRGEAGRGLEEGEDAAGGGLRGDDPGTGERGEGETGGG